MSCKQWIRYFIVSAVSFAGCGAPGPAGEDLGEKFDGKYGQIEIGGHFAGAEFHKSRPLPSRISFYYPVANSIDLSRDYWKRYESRPFTLTLQWDGITDTLGQEPYEYQYTPFSALFQKTGAEYSVKIRYDFCADLPVLVYRIVLTNNSREKRAVTIATKLRTTLRPCHSYGIKNRARVRRDESGAVAGAVAGTVALTAFDEVETDSVLLFVANAGCEPVEGALSPADREWSEVIDPVTSFHYRRNLEPGGELGIVQLIGTCRQEEGEELIADAVRNWRAGIAKNERKIRKFALGSALFRIPDSALQKTAHWSKAVLAANVHYLDGRLLPMPCPAEYNFFFTHDALVTGLGAVLFDLDWVKTNLEFLHSLCKSDRVLPHAYYWRDGGYTTEFCGSDNWNHLWFIIAVGSYLKHSGDRRTVETIHPMLDKSISLVLTNMGADTLMYAARPDWWDIGNLYGARSYLTLLTITALQNYAYISMILGKNGEDLAAFLHLGAAMRRQLVRRLWDPQKGFLMNGLDESHADPHFYSGSLLAAHFDLLDDSLRNVLLDTAEKELLDRNLGIRNAMPPDFHRMSARYGFQDNEAGEPYLYFNGGIWPQGNAWYALGLISAGRADAAGAAVAKYMSIEGIRNSPKGQPSFYEYRMGDPDSPQYGRIDKPTFLWAAGWYLYTLYHLSGMRENPWNISFDPHLPTDLEESGYDLTFAGRLCRVEWKGTGDYFRRIRMDGTEAHSSVLFKPCTSLVLERGTPESPYLCAAGCVIEDVVYHARKAELTVTCLGIEGQEISLNVISPVALKKVLINGAESSSETDEIETEVCRKDGLYICRAGLGLPAPRTTAAFLFEGMQ